MSGPPALPGCVFLGRAKAQLSNKQLWDGLLSGALAAGVYSTEQRDCLKPLAFPAMGFFREDPIEQRRVRRLAIWAGRIETRDLDRRRSSRIRRAIPVMHWLYIGSVSFEKFLKTTHPTPKSRAPKAMVTMLAKAFGDNQKLTRSEAAAICKLDIRSRVFNRVWADARVAAGLPAQADAGRKSTR
jgi:hypothetical protein